MKFMLLKLCPSLNILNSESPDAAWSVNSIKTSVPGSCTISMAPSKFVKRLGEPNSKVASLSHDK